MSSHMFASFSGESHFRSKLTWIGARLGRLCIARALCSLSRVAGDIPAEFIVKVLVMSLKEDEKVFWLKSMSKRWNNAQRDLNWESSGCTCRIWVFDWIILILRISEWSDENSKLMIRVEFLQWLLYFVRQLQLKISGKPRQPKEILFWARKKLQQKQSLAQLLKLLLDGSVYRSISDQIISFFSNASQESTNSITSMKSDVEGNPECKTYVGSII